MKFAAGVGMHVDMTARRFLIIRTIGKMIRRQLLAFFFLRRVRTPSIPLRLVIDGKCRPASSTYPRLSHPHPVHHPGPTKRGMIHTHEASAASASANRPIVSPRPPADRK